VNQQTADPFRQLRYLSPPEHLSGRDLADKLGKSMDHIHAWRVEALARMATAGQAPR